MERRRRTRRKAEPISQREEGGRKRRLMFTLAQQVSENVFKCCIIDYHSTSITHTHIQREFGTERNANRPNNQPTHMRMCKLLPLPSSGMHAEKERRVTRYVKAQQQDVLCRSLHPYKIPSVFSYMHVCSFEIRLRRNPQLVNTSVIKVNLIFMTCT